MRSSGAFDIAAAFRFCALSPGWLLINLIRVLYMLVCHSSGLPLYVAV